MLPVAVAQSYSDCVATCSVFPVLWMTLNTFLHNGLWVLYVYAYYNSTMVLSRPISHYRALIGSHTLRVKCNNQHAILVTGSARIMFWYFSTSSLESTS